MLSVYGFAQTIDRYEGMAHDFACAMNDKQAVLDVSVVKSGKESLLKTLY